MQDNVRRKCIFHPYLTIQCHHHVGHQNSSHDHASLDFYFEEEPVVVGDAPRQHVGPFVSVIYWTYHIKQVLNFEIRQQGKASDHSTFSCECQENILACIAWQFCWEHYWARSCKNARKVRANERQSPEASLSSPTFITWHTQPKLPCYAGYECSKTLWTARTY